MIRRKSFSVVLKIPYVKIQIFRDRSFTWFLNYFLTKFLEIVTTGSLEIGKFLRRQPVSMFRATAHAVHLTGFLGRLLEGSSGSFRFKQTMCKSVNTRFLLPFYFYFCLFCFFKSCAGFYTTPLTARKLCSATLRHV